MNLKVYSIFDEKALAYARPFYFSHHGEATRAFQTVVKDKGSDIGKYPSDYKLYCLGSFDNVSGKFEAQKEPLFICNALDFVEGVTESNCQGEEKV